MPRNLTITNPETGQKVNILWHSSTNPTDKDMDEIFAQNETRNASKRASLRAEEDKPLPLTPMQKVASNPIVSSMLDKANEYLPKAESINPFVGGHKLVSGIKQLITGKGLDNSPEVNDDLRTAAPGYYSQLQQEQQNPPQFPRMRGLANTIEGGLNLATHASLPAMARSVIGGGAARLAMPIAAGTAGAAATKALLPSSTPPEVSDALAGVVGLGMGGVAGKLGSRLIRPQGAISEVLPPTEEPNSLIPQRPATRWNPGRTDPIDTSPRGLPPARNIDSRIVPPNSPPRLEAATEPVTRNFLDADTPIQQPGNVGVREINNPKNTGSIENSGNVESPIPSPQERSMNRTDSYYDAMKSLDDPDTHETNLPAFAAKAKELGISPNMFERDMKDIYNVPQEKIDSLVAQHYPEAIDHDIEEYEDPSAC